MAKLGDGTYLSNFRISVNYETGKLRIEDRNVYPWGHIELSAKDIKQVLETFNENGDAWINTCKGVTHDIEMRAKGISQEDEVKMYASKKG